MTAIDREALRLEHVKGDAIYRAVRAAPPEALVSVREGISFELGFDAAWQYAVKGVKAMELLRQAATMLRYDEHQRSMAQAIHEFLREQKL